MLILYYRDNCSLTFLYFLPLFYRGHGDPIVFKRHLGRREYQTGELSSRPEVEVRQLVSWIVGL